MSAFIAASSFAAASLAGAAAAEAGCACRHASAPPRAMTREQTKKAQIQIFVNHRPVGVSNVEKDGVAAENINENRQTNRGGCRCR
jgi:hypothetical protein